MYLIVGMLVEPRVDYKLEPEHHVDYMVVERREDCRQAVHVHPEHFHPDILLVRPDYHVVEGHQLADVELHLRLVHSNRLDSFEPEQLVHWLLVLFALELLVVAQPDSFGPVLGLVVDCNRNSLIWHCPHDLYPAY